MKNKRRFLSVVLILTLVVAFILPPSALAELSARDQVSSLLRNSYVEPVSEEILTSPTITEMLKQLGDPYTSYLTAEQYNDFNNSLELKFSGIGIYMDMVAEGVKINAVIPGSPAEKALLQSEDIIIQAGERTLAGLPAEEANSILRGPEGSSVVLSVLRSGTTFTVTVVRAAISIPTVTSEMELPGLGYIDINTFGIDTASLFASSMESINAQNAKGYIIDLRDNGGGYVYTALDIAGYFIGDQVAMKTKYRNSSSQDNGIKHSYKVNAPTIFVINKNSASASEILSGAVKDYGKAIFLGTGSYGKGCMQAMYGLQSGDYLKMTIAYFYSPLGHQINKVGITPDLLIEKTDSFLAARLLLSASANAVNKNGLVKLELGGQEVAIDTQYPAGL